MQQIFKVNYIPIPVNAFLVDERRAYVCNNKAHVTGAYQTAEGKWASFLYNGSLIPDLTPSGNIHIHPNAIHDDDTIIGHAFVENDIFSFIYHNGNVETFRPENLFGSRAVDLNESKQILIQVQGSHAFLYEDSRFYALNSSSDVRIQAEAINNSGSIVGGIVSSKGSSWIPFYTVGTTVIPLELPRFSPSKREGGKATANNNRNHIIGTYGNTNGVRCSFFYHQSNLQVLPSMSEKQSKAVAINDNDTIVGYGYNSHDLRESTIALIWNEGKVANLNTLVKEPGLHLYKALDINNNGNILCFGRRGNKEVLVILYI